MYSFRSGKESMYERSTLFSFDSRRPWIVLRQACEWCDLGMRRRKWRLHRYSAPKWSGIRADRSKGCGLRRSRATVRLYQWGMGPECMARTGIAARGCLRNSACSKASDCVSVGGGGTNAPARPGVLEGRDDAVGLHVLTNENLEAKTRVERSRVDPGLPLPTSMPRSLCHGVSEADLQKRQLARHEPRASTGSLFICAGMAAKDTALVGPSGGNARKGPPSRAVADPRQMEAWGPSMVDPMGNGQTPSVRMAYPGAEGAGEAGSWIPRRSEPGAAVRSSRLGCLYPLQARSPAMLGGEAL